MSVATQARTNTTRLGALNRLLVDRRIALMLMVSHCAGRLSRSNGGSPRAVNIRNHAPERAKLRSSGAPLLEVARGESKPPGEGIAADAAPCPEPEDAVDSGDVIPARGVGTVVIESTNPAGPGIWRGRFVAVGVVTRDRDVAAEWAEVEVDDDAADDDVEAEEVAVLRCGTELVIEVECRCAGGCW